MSERGDDPAPTVSEGWHPTPVEARQEAADRLVGRRTLLALRSVAIVTAVVFGTVGIFTDPDIGPVIESESVRILALGAFALLGVVGMAAAVVCRRPARRQVFWLRESIIAAGWLPILAGTIGLIGDLDGPLPTAVFAVAVISGLMTLVLLYVWRAR